MKKHYFKRLIAISLVAMSALSCSQSDREVDGYEVDSGGGLPISFTASTKGLDSTRATATTFESGDQIGIYSTFADEGIANAEFENVGYKYDVSEWSPIGAALRSDADESYDYFAYYPYSATVASAEAYSFTVKSDQSTAANYKASDLLTAVATAVKGEDQIDFQFKHRLSMLRFKITLPSGTSIATASAVTMNFSGTNATATVNIETGAVTPKASTAATITPYQTTSTFPTDVVTFEAFVIPQTISATDNFVRVTYGNDNYSFSLKEEVTLTAGVIKECELTFEDGDLNNLVVISGMSSYITAGDGYVTLRNTATEETIQQPVTASISGSTTTLNLGSDLESAEYEMVSITSGGSTVNLYRKITLVASVAVINDKFDSTLSCFGSGTAADPFEFYTASHLTTLASNMSNTTYNAAYYRQIANIALTSNLGTTIGTGGSPFYGIYDGNGYEVSNVAVTYAYKGQALFGAILGTSSKTATVKNLTVRGAFTANAMSAAGVVGAMYNYTEVNNCVSYVDVTSAYYYAGGVVGGVFLANANHLTTAADTSTIKSQSTINAKIIDCRNYGTVTLTADNVMGGGVVGFAACTVSGCANYGAVVAASSSKSIGGVCGALVGSLSTSFNAGSVGTSGTATSGVGGVVGTIYKTSTIQNCYNAGGVNGSGSLSGGVVGSAPVTNDAMGWKVTNCYSVGKCESSSIGGLMGGFDESKSFTLSTYFDSCYYSSTSGSTLDVANQSSLGSTSAKSNSDMRIESTYSGWDFTSTWKMSSTTPTLLSNEPDSDPALP